MKKWLTFFALSATFLSAAEDGCFDSCACCPIEHSGYLHLKHREPGGIGYPRGYTSLSLFYTGSGCGPSYTFLDLRGHLDNDGKWATNAGIGFRTMAEYADVINGFNFYWDWREADHGSYHKVGLGYEVLFPYWDIRFNGYIPVGRERTGYRKGFDRFEDHSAIMFKKYLLNMGGFDASVGYWLFKCGCVDMHASLGGYYFRGNFNKEFGGGIAKAKIRFWDWIELEGQVSYDNKFKWVGQGELGIYIPFGPTLTRYPRKTGCCADLISLEERLLEQPDRFEISVLASHKREDKARDPRNRQPLNFFFVDNTSSSDGTFESPFPTITEGVAAAGIGDVVYVFPGDGAGYDETITLKNRQFLVGSGAPFEVATRFGKVEIPQMTARPSMIGAGTKVTLANQNLIHGFSITSDSVGIRGTAVSDFTLTNSSFVTGEEGVFIDQFSGMFIADNLTVAVPTGSSDGIATNSFTGSAEITNSIIAVNEGSAIFLGNFSGIFTGDNNSLVSQQVNGFRFNNFAGAFSASNNRFFTGEHGIRTVFSFTGNFMASNNRFSLQDGGILFNNFEGNLRADHNIMHIDGTGIRAANFNGSFVANQNIINTTFDAGFSFTNFSGRFFASHNTINASNASGIGIAINGIFQGSFIGEYNDITAGSFALGGSGGIATFENADLLLRNNTLISNQAPANPAVVLGGQGQTDAIIHNNFLGSTEDGTPVFLWTNLGGLSHIEFANNTLVGSPDPNANFANGGGTMEIESPNLQESGLQAINEGSIDTSGATFVPFE